jgi:hypothetical protein
LDWVLKGWYYLSRGWETSGMLFLSQGHQKMLNFSKFMVNNIV